MNSVAHAHAQTSRAPALMGTFARCACPHTRPGEAWSRPRTASERTRSATMTLTWGNALQKSILSQVACELASNAVLHSASGQAGGTFTVWAQMCPGRAWIAVEDNGGPWARADHQDGRQHGLAIVAQLANGGWGRDGDAGTGWFVWAALEWP